MPESRANTLTDRQRCRRECASTHRYEHGGSRPGGPFPGTHAEPGDVRRCEHARYWRYTHTSRGFFFQTFDRWELLSRFWNPILVRRARRAIQKEAQANA
ncbi:hypothetical protein [Nocardia cyriacigeorgica]|uniref:hypothetical protein n=1 Tax=Nocardia cyriacigeorgica TaxID=135487 RepID=UPI002456F289|nr:hypothetical protein [Nocardia cyriacigeorgica]